MGFDQPGHNHVYWEDHMPIPSELMTEAAGFTGK
jgi:hypothetical protein